MTELFKQFLTQKRIEYKTSTDTGFILFKNEDNFNCVFMADKSDTSYVRIVVPYLITQITDTERSDVLDFCNDINADMKIGKAFIYEDNLWLDTETLVSDNAIAFSVFEFMLKIIKSSINHLIDFQNKRKSQTNDQTIVHGNSETIVPDNKIDL